MCDCDCRLKEFEPSKHLQVQQVTEQNLIKRMQISRMDTRKMHQSLANALWNTSSAQDTSKSQKTMGTSSRTSRSGTSESVTLTSEFSTKPNQSGRRPTLSRRLRKGGFLRIVVITTVLLVALELLASAEAGPLKKPRRSIVHGNAWEHPCGDGTYQERTDNRRSAKQMKKNYIKDVYTQSRRMGKQLDRKEQDSHWLDGDWEHTLPDDFEFPDLSRFTFRKAHSALQQYLAIFQKFTSMENDPRRELKGTFQKMQTETRSLLCFIESVINGTHVIAKRNQGLGAASGGKVKPRPAPYRYYTQHVMERKLKGLTAALTEDAMLPIAKVVFSKFKDFVSVLTENAQHRMGKAKTNAKTAEEGGLESPRVNEVEPERNSQRSDSVLQPKQQNAVNNKAQTKKPVRDRKNKKNKQQQRKNKNQQRNGSGRPVGDKRKKERRD